MPTLTELVCFWLEHLNDSYETKHDYRKEPEIQRIQLKNKSDAEFLNQALTLGEGGARWTPEA